MNTPNWRFLQGTRSFKYEVTEQGKVKLHQSSEQAGDDFVDSLCFAVWAAKDPVKLVTNISLRMEKGQVLASKFREIKPMTWDERLSYLRHMSSVRF